MPDQKKKVLFIAHHFPPLGGPGVYRATRFAQHLTEMGYDLHVLTVALSDIQDGTYPADHSMERALPADLKITRVSIEYPMAFRRKLERLHIMRIIWTLFWFRWWEPSARWPKHALKPAMEIIAREGIDVVWTSSGPFVATLLGHRIQKRTGVKWIADLRDPFTEAYFWIWPSKWHWYFSRWMEKRIWSRADKLVVTCPALRDEYVKRGITSADKIAVITNGY
jgi:glycosyltransferase involved in cell wall biosynthesis